MIKLIQLFKNKGRRNVTSGILASKIDKSWNKSHISALRDFEPVRRVVCGTSDTQNAHFSHSARNEEMIFSTRSTAFHHTNKQGRKKKERRRKRGNSKEKAWLNDYNMRWFQCYVYNYNISEK